MPDIITDAVIRDIVSQERTTCVSIYLPTYERGTEVRQNAIRFRNLLEQLKEQLESHADEISGPLQQRLKAMDRLGNDDDFWQHQARGLALFLHDDYERLLKLPGTVDEHVHLGDRFLVTPLASQREMAQSYGVLALTWQNAQLFQGHGSELVPQENGQFPVTFEQLVGVAEPEGQLQYESYRLRGAQSDRAVYHGHGQGEDEIEADRTNYLSRVGSLVAELSYGSDRPIVLVATKEVAGQFRAVSNAEIFAHVEASPESLRGNEMARRVWELMTERHQHAIGSVKERLGNAMAQQQGSQDLGEVAVAALQGRVETLIVRSVKPHFGRVDESTQEVRHSKNQIPDRDECDLVNLAVSKTWQASGQVIHLANLEGDDQASASPLAAIYRYTA